VIPLKDGLESCAGCGLERTEAGKLCDSCCVNAPRRGTPPILVLLWRKTAEAWGSYGRRFELLAAESKSTSHPEDYLLFSESAANAYDHQRRALEKAAELERSAP
jgi:hypothetical protein